MTEKIMTAKEFDDLKTQDFRDGSVRARIREALAERDEVAKQILTEILTEDKAEVIQQAKEAIRDAQEVVLTTSGGGGYGSTVGEWGVHEAAVPTKAKKDRGKDK